VLLTSISGEEVEFEAISPNTRIGMVNQMKSVTLEDIKVVK
jgi:hypothetical protein